VIAHSGHAIDLHDKRREYQQYGAREYIVLSLRDRKFHWFDMESDRPIDADPDGIVRGRTFPGLWMDPAAVLTKNYQRLMEVLQQGLATPEHAEFVKRLAAARGLEGEREA
jgi:hypothetical protein